MPDYTYTTGRPAGNLSPASQRSSMQTNNDSIDSILNEDLIGFNNNNGGFHKKSTYVVQASDPGSAASQVVEYSKTVTYADATTTSELFLQRDAAATAVQMTRKTVSVGANGFSFLPGGILFQWGSIVASPGGTVFTFPTPFLSAVYSVTLGMRAAGAQASAVAIPGLTSVTVFSQSGSQTVYVMAIGV